MSPHFPIQATRTMDWIQAGILWNSIDSLWIIPYKWLCPMNTKWEAEYLNKIKYGSILRYQNGCVRIFSNPETTFQIQSSYGHMWGMNISHDFQFLPRILHMVNALLFFKLLNSTHILHCYFTGTGAIMQSLEFQQSWGLCIFITWIHRKWWLYITKKAHQTLCIFYGMYGKLPR